MKSFSLSKYDVYSVLTWVFYLQASSTLVIGLFFILAPSRSYGDFYRIIFELHQEGDNLVGLLFVSLGLVMLYALFRKKKLLMGITLLVTGLLIGVLGTLLLLGTLSSPTVVIAIPFCFYVGSHMTIQSVLLTKISPKTSATKGSFQLQEGF